MEQNTEDEKLTYITCACFVFQMNEVALNLLPFLANSDVM